MGDQHGLDERFAKSLHETARAWRQALDRRLKHLGVSQAAWMTIAVAAQAGRPLSQSELADALAIEGASMVAMIDRLAKAGLVVREPSTVDRRVNHVVVTAAGRRLHDIVKREAAAVRQELLAHIDPDKLAAATEVLASLRALLEADG